MGSGSNNITFINLTFINGKDIGHGGAILADNPGALTFINCLFINNTILTGTGGAADGSGGAFSRYGGGYASVVNCTFTNNYAAANGGAIWGNANISNSIFSNNFASAGGAVSGGGNIFNSNFTNNTAIGGAIGGGALVNTAPNAVITGCNFTNNNAYQGGAIFNSAANFIAVNTTFTSNNASYRGGAINTGNYALVDNCNFTNNYARNYGGAIENNGNYFNVTNSNFINNIAGAGGAIDNSGSYMNITGSNFTNNNAFTYGGAIYSTGNFASVDDCNFTNNNASIVGGGIWNNGINMNVINSNFTNNCAAMGGGIYAAGNGSTLTYSNFTNNTQGIAFNTINFTLNNNIIIDNGIAIQFALVNTTFTIIDLSTINTIQNNNYSIGISGQGSNYTVMNTNLGTLNYNGIIFTTNLGNTNLPGASYNNIVNSNIFGYNRINSSVAITFGNGANTATGARYNGVINSNITNNTIAIKFNNTSWLNSVINSTIANNGYAVMVNGTNNSVTGSNIINNRVGINITTGSVNTIINYNRILNNTNVTGFDLTNNATGTTNNANYNWWGNNTPRVSGIGLANWFVMELQVETNKTIVNATFNQSEVYANMSYKFVLFTNGTNITSFGNSYLLPNFTVNLTWNGTAGTINLPNVDAKGNYSQIIFLSPGNVYTLEAIGDNADLLVRVNSDRSLMVNFTMTKTAIVTGNVTNGRTVTYIINVTNNGPDNATNVQVNEFLQNSLIFVNATTPFGTYNSTTGVWDIGNLANGSTATLNITFRLNATTNGQNVNVTNHINITSTEQNLGDNKTNSTVTVEPGVNLTITKTVVNTGNVTNGQFVTYIINVTNHGPDTATNVLVNEYLINSLVFENFTTNGYPNYNPSTGVWNISTLSNGSSAILTITFRVNATTNGQNVNVTNRVNVTTNVTNFGDNETNVTVTVEPGVNLTITKTVVNTGNVTNGQFVTYIINVTNNGPDTATNVLVNEYLINSLVFENFTTNGYPNYNPLTGVWNISTLTNGSSAILTITFRVNATTNGQNVNVTNRVNVTTNVTNFGDNETNVTVTVEPGVNLTIIKTVVGTGNFTNGRFVTYIITVTNNGPDTATNVLVNEYLQNSLVFENATSNGYPNYDPFTGVWDIGNLVNGSTATLTITFRLNATTNGQNVNVTTNVTNFGDNETNVTVTVEPGVNLTINKTANETSTLNGGYFTYTITVTNYGPDIATNVTVSEVLDNRLESVYSNATKGNWNGTVWTIGNLTNGQTVTLTIDVKVKGIGLISNLVTVYSHEKNIANATTDVEIYSGAASNMTVTKTVNKTNVTNGEYLTYTITVHNNGPDNAYGVVVKEAFDYRLKLISSNASQGDWNNSIWTIGNISTGNNVTLIIIVQVNGSGTIDNNVTINSINGNNTGDNTTSVRVYSQPVVNLTLKKVANVTDNVRIGDIVQYTITVTNNGPDTATNVKVNELLPNSLIYQNSTTSMGYYNPTTGVWTIGNLSAGATVTMIITVKVNGTGDITNAVNITSDQININNDTNGKNITATITVNDKIKTNLKVTAKLKNNGKTIEITGVLTDESGNLLANKTVKFYVNGKYVGSAVTNNDGVAVFDYTQSTPFKNGVYTIYGEFAGYGQYLGSNDTTTLKINNKANDTNKTTNVSAVSKTTTTTSTSVSGGVAMKKTGVPIIVIAILMFLLSFVVRIRKRN